MGRCLVAAGEASMNKRLATILWWTFCLGLIGFVIMPFLVH
jgi:hypothetical protein